MPYLTLLPWAHGGKTLLLVPVKHRQLLTQKVSPLRYLDVVQAHGFIFHHLFKASWLTSYLASQMALPTEGTNSTSLTGPQFFLGGGCVFVCFVLSLSHQTYMCRETKYVHLWILKRSLSAFLPEPQRCSAKVCLPFALTPLYLHPGLNWWCLYHEHKQYPDFDDTKPTLPIQTPIHT